MNTQINHKRKNLSKNTFQVSLLFGLILLIISACTTKTKTNKSKILNSTIKFEIDSDEAIENLIFVKFGTGFSSEEMKPFQKKMEITLKEPLNDIYDLSLIKNGKIIPTQLWLKGENIIIKATVLEEVLQIDTILNAPFYYYTINVLKEYEALTKHSKNQDAINNFLLKEIKANITNPFSNELAFEFMNKNLGKPENLKALQTLISTQEEWIKNHPFSIHQNLKKIIEVDSINPAAFQFKNKHDKLASLPIKGDAIYLIDFWFTHCPPCIKDHKVIQSKIDLFKESNIEIIGISTDYDPSIWIDFLAKNKYEWKNYIEVSEDGNSLSSHLGVSVFPTYLIVNGKGEILHRDGSLKGSIAYLKAAKFMK
jgi:thiol-disulfide isomerase/thioredoxin